MGTSVGLDVGVMWRLSEDLNVARRLAARVQQQQQHHHHSIHSHRSAVASSMIYNGNISFWDIISFRQSLSEWSTRNWSYVTPNRIVNVVPHFRDYLKVCYCGGRMDLRSFVGGLLSEPQNRIQMCTDESESGAKNI